MAFKATIGLEIHAELKTRTKMFCACINDPDEKTPNLNICPVCMAHPGSLPVINKEAVKKVLLIGTALGGNLADYTEFDRKNYFYPDIPKGYQISQYKYPLVSGGSLADVSITRVHLEEDTARSQHVAGLADQAGQSLVDYNRAGVPLMELVTEPVIHDAKTAGNFARELQLLLRYLGAGEANMEKGEMRVEANISVSADENLGTKVEVKNLNSFRSVERAIAYEIERQTKELEKGGTVVQETRGWDEVKQVTFSQRKKESSHDYRYFPDPDLPNLKIPEIQEFSKESLKKDLPELPWEKRERYRTLGFLQEQDIEQLVSDSELSNLLLQIEQILVEPALIKTAANFILNDVVGQRRKDPTWPLPDATFLAEVVRNYQNGTMAAPQAKSSILSGQMSAAISDTGALDAIARKVVNAYPQVAADYKGGKESALQFLVGQGMKESKGSANPAVLRDAILKVLQ
ncbi:MAG TPA: Asp-tRNA(Asn)/Glu-tRNA(Gln) amidotransferase subunit GatB [Candidatus Paceibacterota bacterium]|nr:Asp-tRNA(Asn)/Glu-tRNA(Gln) amidotransferase subunit GatB [Candidatus Paceibacterota bacterium]